MPNNADFVGDIDIVDKKRVTPDTATAKKQVDHVAVAFHGRRKLAADVDDSSAKYNRIHTKEGVAQLCENRTVGRVAQCVGIASCTRIEQSLDQRETLATRPREERTGSRNRNNVIWILLPYRRNTRPDLRRVAVPLVVKYFNVHGTNTINASLVA